MSNNPSSATGNSFDVKDDTAAVVEPQTNNDNDNNNNSVLNTNRLLRERTRLFSSVDNNSHINNNNNNNFEKDQNHPEGEPPTTTTTTRRRSRRGSKEVINNNNTNNESNSNEFSSVLSFGMVPNENETDDDGDEREKGSESDTTVSALIERRLKLEEMQQQRRRRDPAAETEGTTSSASSPVAPMPLMPPQRLSVIALSDNGSSRHSSPRSVRSLNGDDDAPPTMSRDEIRAAAAAAVAATTSGSITLSRRHSSAAAGGIVGLNASKRTETLRRAVSAFEHSNRYFEAFGSVAEFPEWRLKVRSLVVHPYFDIVSSAFIICNCIFLALWDPTAGESTTRNRVSTNAEYFFLSVFVLELALKLVGLGVWGPKTAYFRDGWNRLDFIIIVSGVAGVVADLTVSQNPSGLSALRAVRLLRPLRALTGIPHMKVIINSMIRSMPALVNVVLMYFLFLITLSVLGVQLFKGRLRYRCVDASTGVTPEDLGGTVCNPYSDATSGVAGFHCPWGYDCAVVGNPDYGYTSFDDVGHAAFVLFTSVTWEGWTEVMYNAMNATTDWACIYFVIAALVGNLFIINLTLVIINYEFTQNVEMEREKMAVMAESMRFSQRAGSMSAASVLSERRSTVFSSSGTILLRQSSTSESYPSPTLPLDSSSSLGAPSSSAVISPNSSSSGGGGGRGPHRTSVREEDLAPERDRRSSTSSSSTTAHRKKKDAAPTTTDSVWGRGIRAARSRLRALLRSRPVVFFVTAAIVLNTAVMASEHHNQPMWLSDAIKVSNLAFTALFSAELAANLFAFWWRDFVRDRFLMFDLLVVVLSWVDLIFVDTVELGFSVFRGFRLLRVFKVAKFSATLQLWLDVVLNSILSASLLTLLLGLAIFVFALVGLQLFGGKMCDDAARACPRHNFESLGFAMLTVFQVLTGENWNTVMFDVMDRVHPAAVVYFLVLYIIGAYLVLNLFIAVLLNARPADGGESSPSSASGGLERHPSILRWRHLTSQGGSGVLLMHPPPPLQPDQQHNNAKPNFAERVVSLRKRIVAYASEHAFCLLSSTNPLRRWAKRLLDSLVFDIIVLLVIAFGTVLLMLEDPRRPPDHPMTHVLQIGNLVVAVLFLTELLLKLLVFGVVFPPGAYFRRAWNVLDFVIIVASLVGIFVPSSEALWLNALRPLRFASHSTEMRLLVNSLMRSLPPLGGVASISLLFWLLFAVLGVQLFKGSFGDCSVSDDVSVSTDTYNKTYCETTLKGTWTTPVTNFDNVGSALLTLFVVATLEGWVDVMHRGMDSRGPDLAPDTNSRPLMAIYFVTFVLIGAFFTLNLFLAVLLDNFDKESRKKRLDAERERSHGMYLTTAQKQWLLAQDTLLRCAHVSDREVVRTRSRHVCYRIISHPYFEIAIAGIIVLNVAVMATESAEQSGNRDRLMQTADLCFISVFFVEAMLKIFALGPKEYFSLGWNRFDAFIVVLSVAGLVVSVSSGVDTAAITAFRIMRLIRLFRVIKVASQLQLLLKTMIMALPSMSNVCALLALLIVVYAAVGVGQFGRLDRHGALNRNANFESFSAAVLLLLRMATGEAWNDVMQATMATDGVSCTTHWDGCGQSKAVSIVYFLSFAFFGLFLLMNLFIAVIINSFNDTAEDTKAVVPEDYVETISKAWKRIDANGTHYIPTVSLPAFLWGIGEPLGWDEGTTRGEQWRCLTELGEENLHEVIDIDGQKFECGGLLHFHDVMRALLCKHLRIARLPPSCEADVSSRWQAQYPELVGFEDVESRPVAPTFAALKIQCVWRRALARQRRTSLRQQRASIDGEVTPTTGVLSLPTRGSAKRNADDFVMSPPRVGSPTGAGSVVMTPKRVPTPQSTPNRRRAAERPNGASVVRFDMTSTPSPCHVPELAPPPHITLTPTTQQDIGSDSPAPLDNEDASPMPSLSLDLNCFRAFGD
eukprot:PhM_4_TR13151/c0_g1_i1/m.24910